MADGKKVTIRCSIHGPLHEATVYCRHESEDTVNSVGRAHNAPYGGACTDGMLHVEMVDEGGKTEEWTHRYIAALEQRLDAAEMDAAVTEANGG